MYIYILLGFKANNIYEVNIHTLFRLGQLNLSILNIDLGILLTISFERRRMLVPETTADVSTHRPQSKWEKT
jgi:hypothetical protein